jgi:hypothetical protein
MPTICATSMTRWFGGRLGDHLVEQEHHVPPSKAGMGRMFMKARMMLRKAVMFQNACQSHVPGNMLPIAPKPPICSAPDFVKSNFMELT